MVAAVTGVSTPYWGKVIIAMALMAAGLAAGTALAAALVTLVFMPARPAATEDRVFAPADSAGSLSSMTANNA